MKKIGVILLSLLLFSCSSKSTTERSTSIELKANQGEVVGITLNEVLEKKDNGESFVFLFSQTYCGSCMSFFSESDAFTKELGLTLYDVTLDKEERSHEENMEILNKHFPTFSSTPAIIYIQDGKMKGELNSNAEEVTLESYKKFLTDNGIMN